MEWPIYHLEQLALPEKGSIKIGPFGSQLKKTELVTEGVHVLGIENVLANKFNGLGERYVTEKKYNTLKSVEVFPGDVLITMMGTIGEVAIVPNSIEKSIMDSHLLRIRPNKKVCTSEYIRWLIKGSSTTRAAINGKAHGAIMKGLNSKIVRSLPAPLPPPSEQRRIVGILDQADALRKKRTEAGAKAMRILPALFYKMFGDPVTNPMGWPMDILGNLGTLERGKSKHRPRNDKRLLGGPHPFIQTGDVANSNGCIKSYSSTYSDFGLAQSRKWPAGTLCITIAANIAESAILGFDSCFPDSVVGFTAGPQTNSAYIRIFLGFLKPYLEQHAPQMAQKNINLKILCNLPVPVPDITLQNRFKKQHDNLMDLFESQISIQAKIDRLWNAIIHRAFTGDLTAKWREAHMKELLAEMEEQAKALA